MEVAALHTLALKLGLTSTNTLRKAEELIRLLAVRGGSRLSLSMSGKAVICLEMAAALTGATVDKVSGYDDSTDGNKGDIDTSLPVYQTAAVVAACKVMNIKVDKRRLFESSCSKRAVYQKLVDVLSVKNNKKRTRTLLDMVEDNLRDCSPEKRSKGTEDGEEEEDGGGDKGTDFEDWKKKILEAAAAAE
ncbi:Origin recognition complex subunit 6-like [Homarus americanus]|uniref:Origin recognition complex subunit 6-like n=1 Tax=Homarus americanus TaxID=6706 RepID=A0A8J5MQT4_HOMAM|nr:Origin recognition complex subunit 6-like [Homarus americanus]